MHCKKSVLSIFSLLFLISTSVVAQQITGTPGSPGATTSIRGNQLPAPDPKFGGVIKDDALQSKPWWAPRIVPPKGAPNVLLIITDDAGFGVPSTFGGVIPTPTMDRIANEGLRYNRMFSTALCSPTRAALITGRNTDPSSIDAEKMNTTATALLGRGVPPADLQAARNNPDLMKALIAQYYGPKAAGARRGQPRSARSDGRGGGDWPARNSRNADLDRSTM